MKDIENTPKIKKKCTIEEAMSLTGFGAYNIYLFLTMGGFIMCVIVETMSMSFIVPAAKCDLNLTLSEQGLLSSINFFGVVATSHAWGFLADTRGRKKTMMISLFLSFISSIACTLVTNSWLFIFLRFINGCFISGSSSIPYAYVGEFHDNKLRPKIVASVATFVAIGNIYIPGMAWLILPQDWSFNIDFFNVEITSWRVLMIIYTLPNLFFTVMLTILPESPKFLLAQGKNDKVLEILKKIHKYNHLSSKEEYEVTEIISEEMSSIEKKGFFKTVWHQTVPLIKKPLLFKSLGVSILHFGIFVTTSGVLMWYPSILNTMSHFLYEKPNDDLALCKSVDWERAEKNVTNSNQTLEIICDDTVKTNVYLVSVIIGIVYALTYILVGILINVVGKKILLAFLIISGTTAGIVSQYIIGYHVIQILLGIFIIGGVGVSIVNIIIVDLFPTQVRAMALALSLMFGRLGAVVGTNIAGYLIYEWCSYLFYIFAIVNLFLVIIITLLPSSQKAGKNIEIQATNHRYNEEQP